MGTQSLKKEGKKKSNWTNLKKKKRERQASICTVHVLSNYGFNRFSLLRDRKMIR